MEPGTRIGRYVVHAKLAEGGMAEIFLVRRRTTGGLGKLFVLKRVRECMLQEPEAKAMFAREARILARLSHPNLVQAVDFGLDGNTQYLVMEWVRGPTLHEVRSRLVRLQRHAPSVLSAHVAMLVAKGLHHAHELKEKGEALGLVHRDVTPSNILLCLDGTPKLIDFGIARGPNPLTRPGLVKGKARYMAPEQVRGADIDRRTDVWGLGVVLWELLAGRPLFQAPDAMKTFRLVMGDSPIRAPDRFNAQVPKALSAIVLGALEREPDRRFQTAKEMEEALGRFVLEHQAHVEDTDVPGFLRELSLAGDASQDFDAEELAVTSTRDAVAVTLDWDEEEEIVTSPEPVAQTKTRVGAKAKGASPRRKSGG